MLIWHPQYSFMRIYNVFRCNWAIDCKDVWTQVSSGPHSLHLQVQYQLLLPEDLTSMQMSVFPFTTVKNLLIP